MLFSISWQFDSIPNVRIEYWFESSWIDSKIIEIDLDFGSISRIEIVGSGRFLKLEPKPDPTASLVLHFSLFFSSYCIRLFWLLRILLFLQLFFIYYCLAIVFFYYCFAIIFSISYFILLIVVFCRYNIL